MTGSNISGTHSQYKEQRQEVIKSRSVDGALPSVSQTVLGAGYDGV